MIKILFVKYWIINILPSSGGSVVCVYRSLFLIYCSGVKRIEIVSLFSSYSLHSQLLIAPQMDAKKNQYERKRAVITATHFIHWKNG